MYLKRMPRGWNDPYLQELVIRILASAPAHHHEFLLTRCYDAAPVHLAADVLSELHAGGLLFLLVPAKIKWLLQPIDTHVPLKFKLYLKPKFAEAVLGGLRCDCKVALMIRLVIQAIRYVLQGHCWEAAFRRNGLWNYQATVSATIMRELGLDGAPFVPNARPTADMLRQRWPKNRAFHENVVMTLVPEIGTTAVSSQQPALLAPALVAAAGPSTGSSVPRRRLRAKTFITP